MRKTIFVLLLLFTITLTACTTEQPPVCTDDQELVNDVCVDKEPVSTYDDRSLVTEECSTLDNIDDWQPVWCEEFDYTGLPSSEKWYYDSIFVNNEEQIYTNSDLDNANVSDGTLKITALKESMGGYDYTSARLTSKYRGDWLYGRFEIRAKLPVGRGTWPAIWMLPTTYEYGGWPHSGEIDIMEHVGYDPTQVHATIHTGVYNHGLNTQIGYSKTVNDAETEFHTYELVWEPHFMEVFVDGDSYGRFGFNPLANVGVENFEAWPFDQEFHMILNVAIGGMWGGIQGVDDSIFPTTMEVDYVRVYQKDYAGMDESAPDPVSNLYLLDAGSETLQFSWVHAEDDVLVKEYEIYVDDVLNGTTTVNSYMVEDLDPDTLYVIDVYAVDFAGNKSEAVTTSFTTNTLPSIVGRIEAESYNSQSGVLREDTTDVEGDQQLTYISDGDYMEYELYVPESGTYTITYRVASDSIGEIKLYGKTVVPIETTEIPNSGSLTTWIDVESGTFTLNEGIYTFKIKATADGFVLNYFVFNIQD